MKNVFEKRFDFYLLNPTMIDLALTYLHS